MGFWDTLSDILFPKKTTKPIDLSLPKFPTGDTVVKDLTYLHPILQKKVAWILKEFAGEFTIIETYRTPSMQSKLYAKGRSLGGNIVTNAKAWESYHNYGLALDISHVTEDIVAAFEKKGFEWGGRWKSIKDTPHFQLTFGLKIRVLKELQDKGGLSNVWRYISNISK